MILKPDLVKCNHTGNYGEWVYDHVFINENREENLQFTYYPLGHMIYMEKDSFDELRKDAEEWYLK